MTNLKTKVEQALGLSIAASRPLAVGFGLLGLMAQLSDGSKIAVKALAQGGCDVSGPPGRGTLALEAYMLRELKRRTALPVPDVLYADDQILVMSWIDTDEGAITPQVERHGAELLAGLHAIKADRPGYERDTLIGPLHQPNQGASGWISFFREQRLLHMAHAAHDEGQLPAALLLRLERLAGRLDSYLREPDQVCLLHGDLWNGNILVSGDKIAGLIDPAIYHGHREIELAFTTLFATFGAAFFDAYETLAPLEPDFHEIRCPIYNLYPLLVHVRLFGSRYLGQIEATLGALGL